jgi:ankyrin repeat protein
MASFVYDEITRAIRCDDLERLLHYLPQFDVKEKDEDDISQFQRAASWGRLEMLKLLSYPHCAVETTKLGFTALITAAENGEPDCVKYLIPMSDVDAKNKDGHTALTVNIGYIDHQSLRFLIPWVREINPKHDQR